MKVTSLPSGPLLCPTPARQAEGTMAEANTFHHDRSRDKPARQARNEAATGH